jgi:hypothetical protein
MQCLSLLQCGRPRLHAFNPLPFVVLCPSLVPPQVPAPLHVLLLLLGWASVSWALQMQDKQQGLPPTSRAQHAMHLLLAVGLPTAVDMLSKAWQRRQGVKGAPAATRQIKQHGLHTAAGLTTSSSHEGSNNVGGSCSNGSQADHIHEHTGPSQLLHPTAARAASCSKEGVPRSSCEATAATNVVAAHPQGLVAPATSKSSDSTDSTPSQGDVGSAADRLLCSTSSNLSLGTTALALGGVVAAVPVAGPLEAAADGAARLWVEPSPLDEQGACTLLAAPLIYKPTAQWVPVCLKVRLAAAGQEQHLPCPLQQAPLVLCILVECLKKGCAPFPICVQ